MTAPTSNIRRYLVVFSDGKTCTALDMHAAPTDRAMRDIREQFQPGYVVSVKLQ